MYNGKKIIAIIPARGGSKGIKDKNIIDINGKPLIAYTIEAAKGVDYIDDIIVSTDTEKISDVAQMYGASVPFLRPSEIAGDSSKTIDTIIDVIEKMKQLGEEYDTVVLLQPTSPLRDAEDISRALEKFYENGEKSLVAVSKVADSPVLIRKILDDTHMEKLLQVDSTVRRQDMPVFYRVNGSIYINNVSEIGLNTSFNDNEVPFVIEESHGVDIDDLKDVEIVKFFLKKADVSVDVGKVEK